MATLSLDGKCVDGQGRLGWFVPGGGAFGSPSRARCLQAPAGPRCSVGARGAGCCRPLRNAGLAKDGQAPGPGLPLLCGTLGFTQPRGTSGSSSRRQGDKQTAAAAAAWAPVLSPQGPLHLVGLILILGRGRTPALTAALTALHALPASRMPFPAAPSAQLPLQPRGPSQAALPSDPPFLHGFPLLRPVLLHFKFSVGFVGLNEFMTGSWCIVSVQSP